MHFAKVGNSEDVNALKLTNKFKDISYLCVNYLCVKFNKKILRWKFI